MSAGRLARAIALAIGFLSLSQEILWVRFIAFMNESLPQAFAFVLMLFLFGIALGAALGKRLCERSDALPAAAALLLALGAMLDAAAPFSIVWTANLDAPEWLDSWMPRLLNLQIAVCVAATAAMKSALFPIALHLGGDARAERVAGSVSRVYFYNIVGSALGPLVTGFWLLNVVGLQSAFLLVASGTLLVALGCALAARSWNARRLATAAIPLALALGAFWMLPESLVSGVSAPLGQVPARVIQNRHGIIHTLPDPAQGDTVYGGNVYDGRFNTSLAVNSNGIHRAYMLAALHPKPARVLMIGLSSGSWARVVAGLEGVEQMDIVEINPGYVTLIGEQPSVSPLLADPRLRLHIDDGRRWLKLNPGERYDLIVMNTTWHWKNFASILLSREFLLQLRAHLNPGGIVYYNATGSDHVVKTAGSVFRHAYLYGSFALAADHDVRDDMAALAGRVWTVRMDGRPALDPAIAADREAVRRMLALPLRTLEQIEASAERPLEVITERNMLTEYRYGRH